VRYVRRLQHCVHGWLSIVAGWRKRNRKVFKVWAISKTSQTMAEEEEKELFISKVFLGTLDEFIRDRDAITAEWNAILARYKQGEDIMDDFRAIQARKPSIFMLIDDIYHKEVELEEKFKVAQVSDEIRTQLQAFKERFAELADEIDLFVLAEIGLSKTKISGV
jgi:hypothetical protein